MMHRNKIARHRGPADPIEKLIGKLREYPMEDRPCFAINTSDGPVQVNGITLEKGEQISVANGVVALFSDREITIEPILRGKVTAYLNGTRIDDEGGWLDPFDLKPCDELKLFAAPKYELNYTGKDMPFNHSRTSLWAAKLAGCRVKIQACWRYLMTFWSEKR